MSIESAVDRILNAWVVKGPNPAYHRCIKAQLKRDWPTLVSAIDALNREADREAGNWTAES